MNREYFDLSKLINARNNLRNAHLDCTSLDAEIVLCLEDYSLPPDVIGRGRPYNRIDRYLIRSTTINNEVIEKYISNKKKAIEYASLVSRGLLLDELIIKFTNVTDTDFNISVYSSVMSKAYACEFVRTLKEQTSIANAHD